MILFVLTLSKTKHSLRTLSCQKGAALIEIVAACCIAGAVTAATLVRHNKHEQLALETTAQVTAAAIASAVNLGRAQWAVNANIHAQLGLHFNSQGIATGLDNNPQTSDQECEALWRHLVVSSVPVESAAGQSSRVEQPKYWRIRAHQQDCLFSYHHYQLPTVGVSYHTQTGEVTLI